MITREGREGKIKLKWREGKRGLPDGSWPSLASPLRRNAAKRVVYSRNRNTSSSGRRLQRLMRYGRHAELSSLVARQAFNCHFTSCCAVHVCPRSHDLDTRLWPSYQCATHEAEARYTQARVTLTLTRWPWYRNSKRFQLGRSTRMPKIKFLWSGMSKVVLRRQCEYPLSPVVCKMLQRQASVLTYPPHPLRRDALYSSV